MGTAKLARPVIPICALCYQDDALLTLTLQKLTAAWGDLIRRSPVFDFTHTVYYAAEMGGGLRKLYCAFSREIDPMQVVDMKLESNRIETESAQEGRRRINIDPGYLEAAKLVLATTKNYSHRIYLGQGIYGDVQLFWRGGRFQSNPWTYPDYQEAPSLAFFTELRQHYLHHGST